MYTVVSFLPARVVSSQSERRFVLATVDGRSTRTASFSPDIKVMAMGENARPVLPGNVAGVMG